MHMQWTFWNCEQGQSVYLMTMIVVKGPVLLKQIKSNEEHTIHRQLHCKDACIINVMSLIRKRITKTTRRTCLLPQNWTQGKRKNYGAISKLGGSCCKRLQNHNRCCGLIYLAERLHRNPGLTDEETEFSNFTSTLDFINNAAYISCFFLLSIWFICVIFVVYPLSCHWIAESIVQ